MKHYSIYITVLLSFRMKSNIPDCIINIISLFVQMLHFGAFINTAILTDFCTESRFEEMQLGPFSESHCQRLADSDLF